MEVTVEHRKHQRYLVRFKCILSTDGVRLETGLVLDLSLGGCRLMSAIHVAPGIPIEIHIRPDQHSPIYIPSAVVCWIGGSAFGVQFKELPELETTTLTRLLWTVRS
jgi:PilZ domain